MEIKVFSMLGKTIYSENLGFRSNGKISEQIMLTAESGTYLVQVRVGEELWYAKILIMN